MVALLKSKILRVQLLAVLAIVVSLGSALAYTEEENFAYIKSILNLLNNDEQCLLPTYDEIDNLHASFAELESTLGSDALEAKLGPDEKLVRKTILDQWVSFQESMNPAVVIRLAKQRAFLCKIEAYQSNKFGSSICTKIKDTRKTYNRDFEKNPVVRYVSHLEMGDVPEEPKADQLNNIILTPVEPKNPNEEEKREEMNEEFDPLVEVPAPNVSENHEQTTTILPQNNTTTISPLTNTTTTTEKLTTTTTTTVPPTTTTTTTVPPTTTTTTTVPPTTTTTTTVPPTTTTTVEPETTTTTIEPETTTTTVEPETTTTTVEPETTTQLQTTSTTESYVFDLNKPAMVSWEKDDIDLEKMNEMPEDSLQSQNYRHFIWPDETPLPLNANRDTVAKYLWVKFCNDPDSVVSEFEPEPEFEISEKNDKNLVGETIPILEDEEPEPLVEEMEPAPELETFAPVIEETTEPPQPGDDEEEQEDEHELEINLDDKEEEEEEQIKVKKIIRRPTNPVNPKELKKKKQEFMRSVNRNQRVMERDSGYHGNVDEPTPPTRRIKKFNEAGGYWMWVDEPVDSSQKKDKWTTLMNNNVCKVSVNKDLHGYNIKKMSIIKKTKNIIDKTKKSMMEKRR